MACLTEDVKIASLCEGTLQGHGEASFYYFFFPSKRTHMAINQAGRSERRSAASSWLAKRALIGCNPGEKNEKYPFQTGLGPAEPVGSV